LIRNHPVIKREIQYIIDLNVYIHIDDINANYIQAITYPYHIMLL
jgi:hypothetical protein